MRAIDYVATALFDIHECCVCISTHACPHTTADICTPSNGIMEGNKIISNHYSLSTQDSQSRIGLGVVSSGVHKVPKYRGQVMQ